jgi:hypothetical protein
VTVAGFISSFLAWVGQSSPPVVRRAPLRGIESGAAQSAGSGILSLACVFLVDVLIEKTKEKKKKKFVLWFLDKC